jgi:hypothetical protein
MTCAPTRRVGSESKVSRSFEVRLRERARAWNKLERSQDRGPLIGSRMHDAQLYGTRGELEVEESIGVRLRACAGIE